MIHKNFPYYCLVVISWLLYVYLSLQAPQTSNPWNLSQAQINLLRLSIFIPYLVIWLVAAYGALHFKDYVKTIRGSSDGEAFHKVAIGLTLIVGGLIVPTLLGTIRTMNAADLGLHSLLTIIINYSYVLIPLVAFFYLYTGSKELLKELKNSKISSLMHVFAYGLVAIFALLYVWLIFTNPNRQISLDPVVKPTYYLPDILIVSTLVIPYLISLILGVLSVINISTFTKNVSGIFYKQALPALNRGIIFVIVASIFLQALVSLGAGRLVGVNLGLILLLIYLLLIFQATGFGLIARGAKKLSKLESIE